jgi:hypothetical protein
MRPAKLLLLVTAAMIAALACKDSNSITGLHTTATPLPVTPTPPPPTPTPNAAIAGDWSGTFVPSDPADCGGGPAYATLALDGQNVTGTVGAHGCNGFDNAHFQGSMQGNTINGGITGPVLLLVHGSITGSTKLTLALRDEESGDHLGALVLQR